MGTPKTRSKVCMCVCVLTQVMPVPTRPTFKDLASLIKGGVNRYKQNFAVATKEGENDKCW